MDQDSGEGTEEDLKNPRKPRQTANEDELESADMAVAMSDVEVPTGLGQHLITVDEFRQMFEGGVFDPDARLELIDGVIFEMSPIKEPHAYAVDTLVRRFVRALDEDRAYVRGQGPSHVNDRSLPQPDVVLAGPPHERYRDHHPRPEEILLVVEVADSSLRTDRMRKIPLFARAGIAEAWLVNIPQLCVEVYTEPVDGLYANCVKFSGDEVVAPAAFPDVGIRVADLLPFDDQRTSSVET